MSGTVVALAGRRIDRANATVTRLPHARSDVVRQRIRELLASHDTQLLVSSAACGADLLALDAASELGIRRVVILPFDRDKFRETSVIDRPGGQEYWGPLFDRILAELPLADVITIAGSSSGSAAYAAANGRILDEARRVATATGADVVAAIVWDGQTRGTGDLTEDFARIARGHGLAVIEVPTL